MHDRDTWRSANLLIETQGEDAVYRAVPGNATRDYPGLPGGPVFAGAVALRESDRACDPAETESDPVRDS